MIVEELNFNAIENQEEQYNVYVGSCCRGLLKDGRTVVEGEVRGAYLDENMDYRVVVLVKHVNFQDILPSLQIINVKDVIEWSVPYI